jgi:ATP-dependent helicase YprA (DUF1998 family)
LCDCDCEMAKGDRWKQIRKAMAETVIEDIQQMVAYDGRSEVSRALNWVIGRLEREGDR